MLFSVELAKAEEVFVLDTESQLQTIERKHMQFLEGYDEHATVEQLQKAVSSGSCLVSSRLWRGIG